MYGHHRVLVVRVWEKSIRIKDLIKRNRIDPFIKGSPPHIAASADIDDDGAFRQTGRFPAAYIMDLDIRKDGLQVAVNLDSILRPIEFQRTARIEIDMLHVPIQHHSSPPIRRDFHKKIIPLSTFFENSFYFLANFIKW